MVIGTRSSVDIGWTKGGRVAPGSTSKHLDWKIMGINIDNE
jgi:hypothetical protein